MRCEHFRSVLTHKAPLLLLLLIVGCGERTSTVSQETRVRSVSLGDQSPKEFLAAIFRRYRNAACYHDAAIVRLTFESEGRLESQTAPLSVWLDQHQLYCQAYDVRVWSHEKEVTAWIADPNSADFDSQVLWMPPIQGRPDLDELLADPVLAERLGAGLAGPPPQLEWLFAAEPMKHLFDGDHHFETGSPQNIAGYSCLPINVDAAGDQYQFWIDQRAGIIRRVDLPPMAFSDVVAESDKTIALSLELNEASFDVPRRNPKLAPFPTNPRYVRSFVSLPPQQPLPSLGTRPTPFRLSDVAGKFTITEKGSDRPVTILIRHGNDGLGTRSIDMLQRWIAMMPQPMRMQIRFAIAVDESFSEPLPPRLTIPVVVDQGGVLASGYRMKPGSLVVLQPDGGVAWMQPDLAASGLVPLAAIVADVLDGVDVPRRLRQQWNSSVKEYQARLADQQIQLN